MQEINIDQNDKDNEKDFDDYDEDPLIKERNYKNITRF